MSKQAIQVKQNDITKRKLKCFVVFLRGHAEVFIRFMCLICVYLQTSIPDRGWGERNGADVADWNGSSSPRKEITGGGRGFMHDNWRRHRGGGEEDDGWRTATNNRTDKWGKLTVIWRSVLMPTLFQLPIFDL